MKQAKVTLVVPKPLHRHYPHVSGMRILDLEGFISSVHGLLG